MATDCQVAILTAGYRVELDARVAGLGPKAINVLPFAGSARATERVELRCACGYGIVVSGPRPPCPMCGASTWQQVSGPPSASGAVAS